MIKNDTVLILGAGASRAYGFPLGVKLKAMIWNELHEILHTFKNNNSVTKQVLVERLGITSVEDDIKKFKNALLLSPDYSIDSFLEHQSDDFKAIGKIGIAACLLPLEKRDYLYDDWMKVYIKRKEDIYSGIIPSDGHWYQYLFNEMSEGCDFENFAENNKLFVITFNYDRSLEYYLLHSLEAKYGKTITECAEVLKHIKIIHVYGSLGELPELVATNMAVPYDITQASFEERFWHYKTAANSLRIIPEERGNEVVPADLSDAHAKLKMADRIYFLGFGFLEDNMNKIFTNADSMGKYNLLKEVGSKCYGTALGLSPHLKKRLATIGLEKMKADLQRQHIMGHTFNFPDCNINDFLLHHSYSKLD